MPAGARVHQYGMGCIQHNCNALAVGLNVWVGCRAFVKSIMPYRTVVGKCRKAGTCLTENKAEPYQ